jgi:hypothetical protein
MKPSDWIAVLEASYNLALPDLDAWLRGLLEPVTLLLERDIPFGMLVARYTPNTLEVTAAAHNTSPELYDCFLRTRAVAPPELLNLLHKTTSALLSTSEDLRPRFPDYYDEWVRITGGTVRDIAQCVGTYR